MNDEKARDDVTRLWRNLDPAHYYDPGETAMLRVYFGLRARKGEPALAELYESPSAHADADDDGARSSGPIRLRRVAGGVATINDLSNAVARICLSGVQDRLPQWGACTGRGVVLGRAPFAMPDRTITPLNPRRLLNINWADSGPGFSWPEDYYLTLLPGFARYVVTASVDSIDTYGVTDFAIGWFRASDDALTGSRRLLLRWWRTTAEHGGGPWAYLFDEGLLDRAEADRMRQRVWHDVG